MTLQEYLKRLPIYVLIAVVFSIIAGILFGQYTQILKPFAEVYVMMLQAVVYPYLIASLIQGIGHLHPGMGLRLAKRGLPMYALYLGIALLTLYLLIKFIPQSSTLLLSSGQAGALNSFLLNITIPSNLLKSLANNFIPAVVIFSIIFGIALQHFDHKENVLDVLSATKQACLIIWRWIILFSPLAIFCLLASTAGTINIANIQGIGTYLLLFFAGVFLLAFWVYPALIASITPLHYKEVLRALRQAFTIAIATTLSVAALPAIEKAMQSIMQKLNINDESNKQLINTTLTISYPLGQLGNLFLYLFMIFASWYFHNPIDASYKAYLPFITSISAIGSPSSAIASASFLASWLQLPQETTALYVELSAITRYGQVIASVMGMAFLTITITLAFYRKIQIQWHKFLFNIAIYIALIIAIIVSSNAINQQMFKSAQNLRNLSLSSKLTRHVSATVLTPLQARQMPPANFPVSQVLSHILSTHTIRVGFSPDMYPFSYFNNKGELVGLDVAYMYQLAKTFNAKLIFIPYVCGNVIKDLQSNKFDIAIGGFVADPTYITDINFTMPYLISQPAFIVKRNLKNSFRTISRINNLKDSNFGVIDNRSIQAIASTHFKPNLYHTINRCTAFENGNFNAILWSKYHALAYTKLHPKEFITIIPFVGSNSHKLLVTFATNKKASYLINMLNNWINLQQENGFSKSQKSYWLSGKLPENTQPRWNVFNLFADSKSPAKRTSETQK